MLLIWIIYIIRRHLWYPMLSGKSRKIKILEAFSDRVSFLSATSSYLGMGSNFDFRGFPILVEIVIFLQTIYTQKISFLPLPAASKKCFYNYK
ncbi:hypothetical protein NIES2100_49150 [Calothrix sp. NIES-2100]|nr:hypothetical protein NIES2100_49150 [Calothrix sp. NIES-2100]